MELPSTPAQFKRREYDDVIRLRLYKDDKTLFYSICDDNSVNPSELLRKYIKQYISENQK
jgi:hypothetical protein